MHLPLLVLSRLCTTAVFMTYAACLSVLMDEWNMTSSQAGSVQGAFTACFAISLLSASVACDRIGAKRVFWLSSIAVLLAAAAFAMFARSYLSALVLLSFLGLTQGGTYTPALMLVASNSDAAKKASAMGWVLSGMSAGYFISITVSNAMIEWFDYRAAFGVTAFIAVLGAPLGYLATRKSVEPLKSAVTSKAPYSKTAKRQIVLLTIGYSGHCWELFGAWSWVPAFLATSMLVGGDRSYLEIGLWTAMALHLTGIFASISSGHAADKLGTRKVLIGFALVGAICSFSIGWISFTNDALLLSIVAIYGFVIIGDSSVLTSAMTDTVPPDRLGTALGWRSVFGIGSGALAPVGFGIALDSMPQFAQWPTAFSILGIGGLVALFCAVRLPQSH